jgi:hypothetical protein
MSIRNCEGTEQLQRFYLVGIGFRGYNRKHRLGGEQMEEEARRKDIKRMLGRGKTPEKISEQLFNW